MFKVRHLVVLMAVLALFLVGVVSVSADGPGVFTQRSYLFTRDADFGPLAGGSGYIGYKEYTSSNKGWFGYISLHGLTNGQPYTVRAVAGNGQKTDLCVITGSGGGTWGDRCWIAYPLASLNGITPWSRASQGPWDLVYPAPTCNWPSRIEVVDASGSTFLIGAFNSNLGGSTCNVFGTSP